MVDHLLFGLSAAVLQLLTNLDNLAVLLALMPVLAHRVAIGGYVAAQTLVLGAALLAAWGAAGLLAAWSGYLGVLPILLGVWTLWRQRNGQPDDAAAPPLSGGAPVVVVVALFLSLSVDTFTVMAPLLADSTPPFRVAAVAGAAAAVTVTGLVARRVFLRFGGVRRRLPALGRLAPWALILAGLYVLSNSGTDVV